MRTINTFKKSVPISTQRMKSWAVQKLAIVKQIKSVTRILENLDPDMDYMVPLDMSSKFNWKYTRHKERIKLTYKDIVKIIDTNKQFLSGRSHRFYYDHPKKLYSICQSPLWKECGGCKEVYRQRLGYHQPYVCMNHNSVNDGYLSISNGEIVAAILMSGYQDYQLYVLPDGKMHMYVPKSTMDLITETNGVDVHDSSKRYGLSLPDFLKRVLNEKLPKEDPKGSYNR